MKKENRASIKKNHLSFWAIIFTLSLMNIMIYSETKEKQGNIPDKFKSFEEAAKYGCKIAYLKNELMPNCILIDRSSAAEHIIFVYDSDKCILKT